MRAALALLLCLLSARAAPAAEADLLFARGREAARPRVVRIEGPSGYGAGFLYGAPDLVATALHVVDRGRPVLVELWGGELREGRLVAVDAAHDLALLRLDAPVARAPLVARAGEPEVGERVLAVGHPHCTGGGARAPYLCWSVSRGVVTGLDPDFVKTDAPVSPGNSGGPLLDGAGQVVGVVSEKHAEGVGLATGVRHLEALRARLGEAPDIYAGGFRALGELTMVMQFDDRRWLGGQTGMGVSLDDRFTLAAQLGVLWRVGEEDLFRRETGLRLRAAVELSHRALLVPAPGIYLLSGLGATFHRQQLSEEIVRLRFPDRQCVARGEPCPVETRAESEEHGEARFAPVATLGVELAVATLSYGFELDVTDPGASTHTVRFGFAL